MSEIKRSSEFWFKDGNIVLQCENTQFRVHQSLLAKHFPIHADASVFALSNESEYVEGCPVARVAGDQPEDWANVLMAVYNPFNTYSSTADYPMPVVFSTLRLAHKYKSDHLRDMALASLKTKIPSDLDSMVALLKTNPSRAPAFVQYLFDILNIAIDLGMQSIVPPACLLCIRFMRMEQILNGHTRSDGSTTSLSPAAFKIVISGWQSLNVEAIKQTINLPMRHPLTEYCKKRYQVEISLYDSEVYDCNAKVRAREHASRVLLVAQNPSNAFTLGPIQLCSVCATPIDEEFGLPQRWEELKDFYP